MEDKSEKIKANDIFGISQERADEIIKHFKHARVDFHKWSDVMTEVHKHLKGEAEFGYAGYCMGRLYEDHEDPMRILSRLFS